jgi:hypothetical protein
MVAISKPTKVTVGQGFYWNYMNGETVRLDRPGALPAEHRKHYLRLPVALLMLGGPVLGVLFVFFLPIMAIFMVATAPIQALRLRARARATAAAVVQSPAQGEALSPMVQRTE